ncbi:MAG: hypothetical protein HDR10_10565 [Lachnospiraceae bacterium]|nr:hypothetical protein [Lachnospiraceae bacterium]
MKNLCKITLLTTAALSFLLLGGCGQKLGEEFTEEVNTLEGATLTVEETSVSPVEITYVIDNQSEMDLSYGQDYSLQMEKDGKWYRIIPERDVAVTLELLWAPAGSQNSHIVNWQGSYGKLQKGHYRIIKSVADNVQGYYLAGEFQVE